MTFAHSIVTVPSKTVSKKLRFTVKSCRAGKGTVMQIEKPMIKKDNLLV